MSETYNNVPMSDAAAQRVARVDAFWTGPKLVLLSFVVLAGCFALLWAAAEGLLTAQQNEADLGQESHFLQLDPERERRFD